MKRLRVRIADEPGTGRSFARGNIVTALLFFCVSLLVADAAHAADSQFHLTIDSVAVSVSGVSPGGSVVLFSCTRTSSIRSIAVKPSAIVLRDQDHDGVIRYAPTGGVPLRSVWIAVDEGSGQAASIAPADFPLLVSAIGGNDLKKDVEGEIASMGLGLPRLSLLVVRPGTGAWIMTGFDGEATDHDQRGDGRVELAFEDAKAVSGKDKAPKHLRKGDTVVAIDPGHLDVFMTTIDK